MSVYFASVGGGRYLKVGYSLDPQHRVENLWKSSTRYGRPADCSTEKAVLVAIAPGGRAAERFCHLALSDFAVGCEFFVDEPEVRAFIAEAQAERYPHVVRPAGPVLDPEKPHPGDAEAAELFGRVLRAAGVA